MTKEKWAGTRHRSLLLRYDTGLALASHPPRALSRAGPQGVTARRHAVCKHIPLWCGGHASGARSHAEGPMGRRVSSKYEHFEISYMVLERRAEEAARWQAWRQ